MKIEVTQEDIQRGEKRNCYRCPIALAIERVIKKTASDWNNFVVKVEPVECFLYVSLFDRCVVKHIWNSKCFTLPPKARPFVLKFDSGKPVQPFSFDLPLEELLEVKK